MLNTLWDSADIQCLLLIRLPLSKDVPLEFRVLPEYMIEDVIEYMVFVTR